MFCRKVILESWKWLDTCWRRKVHFQENNPIETRSGKNPLAKRLRVFKFFLLHTCILSYVRL